MPKALTIAYSAQKGGVAKSTSTINTAAYFARHGKKVLVIDLDGQCNSTGVLLPSYSTLSEIETVAAMLSDQFTEIGASVVYPSVIENLDIIPSHPRLSEAETIMNGLPVRESRLSHMLESIKPSYDYIFIDCPPNLNMLPINAWTASDYIIVPIMPSSFDLQGLGFMLKKVEETKKFYNANLRILGYLTTLFDSRNSISHEVYQILRDKFGDLVFDTKIPINTALAKANGSHIDIFGYDPRSNAALAYKAYIEKELLQRI